jgi:hypothetical protein
LEAKFPLHNKWEFNCTHQEKVSMLMGIVLPGAVGIEATTMRLPAIYITRDLAAAGGLISYGAFATQPNGGLLVAPSLFAQAGHE